jgi:hypothetical protein
MGRSPVEPLGMIRSPRRVVVLTTAVAATLAAGWLPARAVAPGEPGGGPARPPLSLRRAPLGEKPPALSLPTVPVFDAGTTPTGAPKPFNLDRTGVPQNEETVTSCRSRPDVVLGAENDYRGLVPEALGGSAPNYSGWQLSLDGGASVVREGVLPQVVAGNVQIPSDGDPVVAAAPDCHLYYGSLNLASNGDRPSAITVYRSTPETLAACRGGLDPACWPAHQVVASSTATVSQDKPWLDVGVSGGEVVVWVAWTDFRLVGQGPAETASIKAARCDDDLSACTAPILISGAAPDVQFADVTIGPDGRTYLTWVEVHTDPVTGRETFVHKLRIAPAGSTLFGPTRIVATERNPIGFNSVLHADDFRITTYPKNAVATVNGRPRIFVTWESCRAVVDPTTLTCEEPRIRLRFSDDDGVTWTEAPSLSAGGDNYFPTIDADPDTGQLAIAYYTSRADPSHHRQQVELVTVSAATARVSRRQTLSPLNEPDADPHLEGTFIGDYFEVSADHGRALVHFNANDRLQKFVGTGVPVPQQDNYLVVAGL